MVCEVAIIILFDVVVFVVGGPEGRSLAGLNPAALAEAPALGLGLLFAAVAFLGFEATAIYGEEAKDPERSIPRATYVAVGLITGFYTVTMLALSVAYGDSGVVAAAEANPAGFVLEANTEFVGTLATDIATALVITSYFAAILALHNTLSRYVLSLGRTGALPGVLARTHHRFQSPHIASLVGTALSLLAVVAAVSLGLDPFAQLFAWLTGLGTIGIFCLQAAASVAVVLYFRRDRRGVSAWNAVVAPALAAVAIAIIVYLAVSNWGVLSGAVDGYAVYLPVVIPVAAVAGLMVATVRGDALGSLQSQLGPDSRHHASQALISGLSPDESQADSR
jgi:amino acid transporter